jgi:hypothetical protein
MSLRDGKYVKVVSFLNGSETEIEDFSRKVCKGGWLRPALISHLCYLYKLERADAENMIDEWIKEEQ